MYGGNDIITDQEIAAKFEPLMPDHPQLAYERTIYKRLRGGVGFPRILWFGREKDHIVMVMERLGPNLEQLFEQCGRKFSLKTVLLLAVQMVCLFLARC